MRRVAFFGLGVLKTARTRGIPSMERLLNDLAAEYEIVFYRLDRAGSVLAPGKVTLRSVPDFPLPHRLQYFFLAARFLLDHLSSPFQVINALAATPAGRLAVNLGKLLNVPVVIHLHAAEVIAYAEIGHGDLLNARLRRTIRSVCLRATCLTVLSEFQKRQLDSNLSLATRCEVIPRGVDLNRFPYQEREPGHSLELLYVGYNQPVKDPAGVLEVLARVGRQVEANLTLVGKDLSPGAFDQELLTRVAARIQFAGEVLHEDMHKRYARSHILLVTSYFESQCAAAVEAMACGVLVCGTRVGVLSDLSGVCCLTVQPGDYDGLAEIIVRLSKDTAQQKELRRNALDWVQSHDSNWTARKYRELFETLQR